MYIWTAVSVIEKGIKLLSDINLLAAIAILLGSFLIGPTVKMINALINGMGMYIGSFVRESLHIEPFGDNSWINDWTVFYWAWWIAWAPFVGTFIARISRGRTIREFIIGVIVAPSLASFVWFAIFGVLGIDLINVTDLSTLEMLAENSATALFGVLKYYPLGSIISLIAVFLLCTFLLHQQILLHSFWGCLLLKEI
nr:BCCT family transporter [Caloranaerobacter azorensis]